MPLSNPDIGQSNNLQFRQIKSRKSTASVFIIDDDHAESYHESVDNIEGDGAINFGMLSISPKRQKKIELKKKKKKTMISNVPFQPTSFAKSKALVKDLGSPFKKFLTQNQISEEEIADNENQLQPRVQGIADYIKQSIL